MGTDRKADEIPDSYLIELTGDELRLLITAAALGRPEVLHDKAELTRLLQRLQGVFDGSS